MRPCPQHHHPLVIPTLCRRGLCESARAGTAAVWRPHPGGTCAVCGAGAGSSAPGPGEPWGASLSSAMPGCNSSPVKIILRGLLQRLSKVASETLATPHNANPCATCPAACLPRLCGPCWRSARTRVLRAATRSSCSCRVLCAAGGACACLWRCSPRPACLWRHPRCSGVCLPPAASRRRGTGIRCGPSIWRTTTWHLPGLLSRCPVRRRACVCVRGEVAQRAPRLAYRYLHQDCRVFPVFASCTSPC